MFYIIIFVLQINNITLYYLPVVSPLIVLYICVLLVHALALFIIYFAYGL